MGHSLGDAALAFVAGAGACMMLGRVAIATLARAQCLQPTRYEDCPPLDAYQQAKKGTPTMGGLFVLAAAVLVAAAMGGLRTRDGWLILGATLGLGAIGLVDDVLKFRGPNATGLRMRPKLAAALAIGAGIGWAITSGHGSHQWLEIPWAHRTVDLGWWWIPFAMIVMAGCSHAVNLTDGMDGLAAGSLAIAFAALGFWTLAGDPRGHALVPWCAALAGACVGFLWFNAYPASVFLGDVGALGLGA
ncbi:MAG: phospho-N-acetylmuramoyl-pentapeptide-transferase, partial [Dehalococcoidia bacterium]|nr:phospho-N-acetylmuramoyl-pentapeptide-transferase [Dehalococcoidia bacterium]